MRVSSPRVSSSANCAASCVGEVLPVVRQAPLGVDRAAARHDAGQAPGGERDVAQQDAGVDGEVIHSLLRLLDQGVAIDLPGQLLGLAAHLLERLVDRHGADWHRRVAQDPLAGLVDVLAGREVHDRVGAPADGPGHLLHLLVDRRGDGGVADVGVDLDQEVAADDHRLALGMVDVGRNDGPPARHLVPHEVGSDELRDGGPPRLARVPGHAAALRKRARGRRRGQSRGRCGGRRARVHVVVSMPGARGALGARLVLANGDELHLGRDDAAARVVHLRHVGARAGTQRPPRVGEPQPVETRIGRAAAPVLGGHGGQLDDVAALDDPGPPQRREPAAHVDRRRRVGVRPRGVVDQQRSVRDRGSPGASSRRGRAGSGSGVDPGRSELDLAHRHPHVRPRSGDIDLARGGERLAARGGARLGLGGRLDRIDHRRSPLLRCWRCCDRRPEPSSPGRAGNGRCRPHAAECVAAAADDGGDCVESIASLRWHYPGQVVRVARAAAAGSQPRGSPSCGKDTALWA
jgi:hypothetical protein